MGIWLDQFNELTSWRPPSAPPPGPTGHRVVSEVMVVDSNLATLLTEYFAYPANRTRPPAVNRLYEELIQSGELLPSTGVMAHHIPTGEMQVINAHTRIRGARDAAAPIILSMLHVFVESFEEIGAYYSVQDTPGAVRSSIAVINSRIDSASAELGADNLRFMKSAILLLASGFGAHAVGGGALPYQAAAAIMSWRDVGRWILDALADGDPGVRQALRRSGPLGCMMTIADVKELRAELGRFLDAMLRQDWRPGTPPWALAVHLTRLRPKGQHTKPAREAREFGRAWEAFRADRRMGAFKLSTSAGMDERAPMKLDGTAFDGKRLVRYHRGLRDGLTIGLAMPDAVGPARLAPLEVDA